ncbi:MAG: nucleoside hydrolase [Clostridia bacterium]|nr:nucleoside hydrolase [Clostridia bacterium]
MQKILDQIKSAKPKKIILDTDAYNEIDDQFTIAYAMRCPETVEILSINAAPFLNSRSTDPGDGMEKSYREIFNIMHLTDPAAKIPVYRGSTAFLTDKKTPVESEAADNIINTVLAAEEPIYVVAIGAITNVASAIIKCPEICSKMTVIWLGGHALHWPNTREFNLRQDVAAAQVVFDSKVPLALIPCNGVCNFLATSVPELQYYLGGKNELCDYLVKIVAAYTSKPYAWSKVIWDVSAIALLTVPEALETVILPTPVLTDDCYFANDTARHPFIYVRYLKRDVIFAHLFKKLAGEA